MLRKKSKEDSVESEYASPKVHNVSQQSISASKVKFITMSNKITSDKMRALEVLMPAKGQAGITHESAHIAH